MATNDIVLWNNMRVHGVFLLTAIVAYLLFLKFFQWAAKRWIKQGSSVLRYVAFAAVFAFFPIVVLETGIVWRGWTPAERYCGGWLDLPAYSCDWGEYIAEGTEVGVALLIMPLFVWMAACCHALCADWRKRHQGMSAPANGTKVSGTSDPWEGNKRG